MQQGDLIHATSPAIRASIGGKMKENIYIQVNEDEKEISFLKSEAKKDWKSAGRLMKDIKSIDFYIKPHENKCYYLINQDFDGSINLF